MERAIADATGSPARIAERRPVGGGCINDAEVLTLADGRRFFAKSNAAMPPGMFEREAEGLAALADVGAIRVPKPVCTGGGDGRTPAFLVLEFIDSAPRRADFQEELGRRLALLHRKSQSDRFGFDLDNYIGSTPQPNGWCDDWVEFRRERRLRFQFDLARRNGFDFGKDAQRLLDALPEIIGEPAEPPCLLHGDLWSGNVMADQRGEPVLIDPGAYYGRREADIAMTMLFGGFTAEFFRAYEEAWPFAPGRERRLEVYKLYHVLNHANLFGGGYADSARSAIGRILR